MKEDEVGGIIMGYTMTTQIIDTTIKYLIDGIERVVDKPFYKPVFWMNFVAHTPNDEQAERLEKLNIPVLPPAMYGMKILSSLNDFVSYDADDRRLDFRAKTADSNAEYTALSESQSKMELKNAGIDISEQIVVDSEKLWQMY